MRVNIHHFVVTSVLAHAAIIAVWASTSSQRLMIPAAEASAPTLHVALQTSTDSARKTVVRHQPHQQNIHLRHKIKPSPRLKIARIQKRQHTSQQPHTRPASVAHTQFAYAAHLRREEIRNRVLSRIRSDLRQYFVYPLLAQRRGWQGRVVLAFSVEANGTIQNIRVASGSGYPILDTSAVSALSRVHQLYSGQNQFEGNSLHLQLPVIFELQGG